MLLLTSTYNALTNTLTLLAVGAAAGGSYRLVRRRAGQADEELPTLALPTGRAWQPAADGCPLLVLQRAGTGAGAGAGTGAAFVVAEESAPLAVLLEAAHTEGIARAYASYAVPASRTAGVALRDVLRLIARRQEARYAVAENNFGYADALLTATTYPS